MPTQGYREVFTPSFARHSAAEWRIEGNIGYYLIKRLSIFNYGVLWLIKSIKIPYF